MDAGDDARHFAHLRMLFDRLSPLDPAAREAEIVRESSSDPALERELRELLEAHDRHSGNTGRARTAMFDAGAQVLASAAAPGERLGPYVLREVIGRGGMGVVYRAERADGEVRQQVAVKVLQRMHLDEAGIKRFQLERDIVAQLAHPGIARLFDAGTTRDGYPYYAMELVDGEPITVWAAQRELSLSARLDLFLKACDAVRFAHANLVLHRDIKPGNVLVDASGEPKLIDFGIAKPMNALDATQTGLQLFSPSNAAPEQVRGERCGVACDVYQLGTLLYELLAGRTVLGDSFTSPAAVEEAILHRVPARPSEVAKDAAIAKDLRGDLDTIVMRALRKEPEKRYASVEQLADEIRRYQRDEPIAARGGERAYRVRKFIRRNAAALAAGSVIVALVATVGTMQVVQSHRLEQERDAARLERNRAQAVSSFLTNLFQGANPAHALAANLTAAEILKRGRDRIDRELADQPEVRIPLMGTLAAIYSTLGDHDSALRLIEQADAALAAGAAVDDRSRIAYLMQSSHAYRAAGKLDGVERSAREALAIHERLGDPPGVRWEARSELLGVELQRTDRSKWKEIMLGLERELREDPGIDPIVLARARMDLGHSLEFVEEFEAGEKLIREAIATFEARLAPDDYALINANRSLGTMLVAKGDYAGGHAVLEKVLQRETELWGPEAQMVARTRMRIGTALTQLGRFAEAEAELLHAERSFRAIGEYPQPGVMLTTTVLGDLYLRTERYRDAESRFREALELAEALSGPRNANSLELRYGLGSALARQGRWAEAVDVLAPCEAFVSWNMPAEARWAVAYAEALHALRRDDDARALLERAQPLLDAKAERLGPERERSSALRRTMTQT